MYPHYCKACGKKFIPLKKHQCYCSAECRDAGRRAVEQRQNERRKAQRAMLRGQARTKKEKVDRLQEDAARARELGLTYGELQARKYAAMVRVERPAKRREMADGQGTRH